MAVTTQLLGGQVRDELIRLTGTAALLVLGVDRTKSPAAHGALGAIENRVAVHARCPVVLVSRPPELSAKPSGVVVGWSGSEVSQIALAAAAAEASMRRASLSVVTANPVRSLAAQSRTVPPDRADVLRAVTDIERAYPRVSVTLHYLDAEAVESLVREARPTDLMVVGSHTSADPISIRTGPVATAVMLQAPCPVMLVGQLVADTANNLAYTRPVGP
ncbi:nucleotide-binding universal stress UspA family protein [Microlunatus panaciterrae]|uniref:Nucleotide-binding universal stress UspA family protein n=1 Tax=Microlunatus panaciterrae TaxID=400768 RepID=A0ABS2RDP6_9ACTN|nr:nucleotide-binding universal stress UspA family protein [Microlunatus panaciterrae]